MRSGHTENSIFKISTHIKRNMQLCFLSSVTATIWLYLLYCFFTILMMQFTFRQTLMWALCIWILLAEALCFTFSKKGSKICKKYHGIYRLTESGFCFLFVCWLFFFPNASVGGIFGSSCADLALQKAMECFYVTQQPVLMLGGAQRGWYG